MIRWTLAVALGVAVAWMAYARAGAPGQRGTMALLAALRGAAVILIAALVLGAPSAPPRPAAPLVAIDVSASARRGGGDDSTTVRTLRSTWTGALDSAGAGTIDVALFGDSLRDVGRTDLARQVPNDAGSRVRPAVDRAAALGRPLVLVTDGEIDDVDALAEAPAGSRVRLVPHVPKRDVAIADLTVPMSANGGDTLQVAALLASGSAGATEGSLRLELNGVVTGRISVPALAAFATTRVTLPLALPRGARTALLAAVLEVAGDVEPRNDTLRATIEVGDRPPAVFVSTAPDLDVREALVVLRGALAVPTRAYLRLAPGVWREEGSLAPISEADVRSRAAAAGMLVVHGDTSWAPRSAGTRGSRALWSPAPPTALARAGETTRAAEWYANAAPTSPLSAALAGLPWDSLPPLTLAGLPRANVTVLTARLGRQGEAVPAIALREDAGLRTLVISGSGYAGWSMRGGRSSEAFTALWGAIFDWLSAGRGDQRAAHPALPWTRAGEPIRWRRGGSDSVVVAAVTRRSASATDSPSTRTGNADSVLVRFSSGGVEATSAPLSAGVYDVRTLGGASVLVVNASREWVPRSPTVRDGVLSVGAVSTDAPRLSDSWWPFLVALLMLSAEWLVRRAVGLR